MLGIDQLLTTGDVDLSGIKIAQVIDNYDPLCIERVLVRVVGVHDMSNDVPENAIWARHMAPSKASSGEIPDIGDWLYVTFLNSEDPMSIIWWGWLRTVNS